MKKFFILIFILASFFVFSMCGDDNPDDGNGPAPADDSDSDGIKNASDNCEDDYNPDQDDSDNDGIGDECEPTDDDGDGVMDDDDNCPNEANEDQEDSDEDGVGDACEDSEDRDGDGIENASDNCPDDSNKDQNDEDNDGLGNECDDVNDSEDIPAPKNLKVDLENPNFTWDQVDYDDFDRYLIQVVCAENCGTYNELENYKLIEWCSYGNEYVLYEGAAENMYYVGITNDDMNCHGAFLPGAKYKWRVGTITSESSERIRFSNYSYFTLSGNLSYGIEFDISGNTISWHNKQKDIADVKYTLGIQCVTGCDKYDHNSECFYESSKTVVSEYINAKKSDSIASYTLRTSTKNTYQHNCSTFEELFSGEIYRATIMYKEVIIDNIVFKY